MSQDGEQAVADPREWLPTRAELRAALRRGAGLALALALLVFLTPIRIAPGATRVGDLAGCAFLGVLSGAMTLGEAQARRRGWGVWRTAATLGLFVALGAGVGWLQATYASLVFELGSPAEALGETIGRSSVLTRDRSLFLLAILTGAFVARLLFTRWDGSRRDKIYVAAGLSLLPAYVLLGLAEPGFTQVRQLTRGRGGFVFAAAALVLVPLLLIARESQRHEPSRWAERLRMPAQVLFGLVGPLLCFGFNELTGGQGPEWAEPGVWTWWELGYRPEPQRPFYPLILFALAALAGELANRRGAWIELGLGLGVAVSGLFALLYFRALPMALVGVFAAGLGLLGLMPCLTFLTFLAAWNRYRRLRPIGERPAKTQQALAATGAGLAGAGAAWLAARQAIALHAALPQSPPDCYLATLAARGHPALTGAAPVRFADGSLRPVSHQLRVFKAAELVLLGAWPRGHRLLRRGYDRLGPPLARRLGPRSASALHLLLWPLQLGVEAGLRRVLPDADARVRGLYRPARTQFPEGRARLAHRVPRRTERDA